ncbi:MAG: RNA polymerase sigma factor [Sphingomonas sp.]|nr:RNA polymerase sigma factor [Sphingomonas sp.]
MTPSEAFERDLTQLLPRLRRFAHGLSRNPADADDLTQATVERALRARDQWEQGTRLDSWLYRIMRNLWIDTARGRTRKERFEAPEEEARFVGQDPREAIDASIELTRAMAAMERLPGEQREVVALILIEGFGYREVSEMLGLPIGTVSSRLVRGRTALLAMLGGGSDD